MELQISIPWLQWYVIPSVLTVLFVIYLLWPEKKRSEYDGPAAAVVFALLAEASVMSGKVMIFFIIVLLSWIIALVGHYIL